jgi:hypothetical protein
MDDEEKRRLRNPLPRSSPRYMKSAGLREEDEGKSSVGVTRIQAVR